eukprot:UN28187
MCHPQLYLKLIFTFLEAPEHSESILGSFSDIFESLQLNIAHQAYIADLPIKSDIYHFFNFIQDFSLNELVQRIMCRPQLF